MVVLFTHCVEFPLGVYVYAAAYHRTPQAAAVPALQAQMATAQHEASQLQAALGVAERRNGHAQVLLKELQAQAAQRDCRITDLRCAYNLKKRGEMASICVLVQLFCFFNL